MFALYHMNIKNMKKNFSFVGNIIWFKTAYETVTYLVSNKCILNANIVIWSRLPCIW